MTAPTPDRIRQLLASGRKVQQVADLTGTPRQGITSVINNTKGWLLDAATDTVYQPGNTGMTPRLPDGTAPTPDAAPAGPVGRRPGAVDVLLAEAADLADDKAVARELAKAREAITRLRDVVTVAAEREKSLAEVAALEAQLAAAKTRAKELGVRRGGGPAAAGDAKTIRAWAAENDIDCPAHGRIPGPVRAQYDAAQAATS